jgi:hypothetical protein
MGQSSAEAVFELTRAYAKERKAFGKPLEALQTVRHKLYVPLRRWSCGPQRQCNVHALTRSRLFSFLWLSAEIKTELAVGRAFVDKCLELHKCVLALSAVA